jgi:hypothetical protein
MSKRKMFLSLGVATFVLTGCATPALNNSIDVKKPTVFLESNNFLEITKEKKNYAMMQKTVKALISRVNKTAYVFSGSNTRGWDCSGMVRWTYTHFGMELPHSANKQAHIGKRVSKPNVGDIVVFAYQGSKNFYHSAIYAGQNMVVNANLMYGTTVLEPLSNYSKSQIRFVRVLEQEKTQLILGEK